MGEEDGGYLTLPMLAILSIYLDFEQKMRSLEYKSVWKAPPPLLIIIFGIINEGYGEVSWVISAMMESFDRAQVTTNPVNFDSEGMVRYWRQMGDIYILLSGVCKPCTNHGPQVDSSHQTLHLANMVFGGSHYFALQFGISLVCFPLEVRLIVTKM